MSSACLTLVGTGYFSKVCAASKEQIFLFNSVSLYSIVGCFKQQLLSNERAIEPAQTL